MHSIIIDSVGYRKDEVQEFLVKELNCTEKEAFRYVNVSPAEIVVDATSSELEGIKTKLIDLGVRLKITEPFVSSMENNRSNNVSKLDMSQEKVEDNVGIVSGQLIIACGSFGGICLGLATEWNNIVLVVTLILSSVLSGIFFILLGKIIKILEEIKRKI